MGEDVGPSIPDPTGETRTEYGDLKAEVPETDDPEEILQRANSLKWENAFALCSGGKDSTAALHYAYYNAAFDLDGIIFIDTNIGVHEVKEYVQQLGEQFDLPVYIADTRNENDKYRNRITKYGFPGATRQAHRFEYISNKEKPLQKLLTDFDGQSLLISGATRGESEARYEAVSADGIEKDGTRTFVSPLARWTQSDVDDYLEKQGVDVSNVSQYLESSGDCLCGAFADRFIELSQLRDRYRYLHTYIQSLEARVIDASRNGDLLKDTYDEFVLWGHGSMTDPELEQAIENRGGDNNMRYCRSCEPAFQGFNTSDMYQTLTERALRDESVSLPDTETAYRDEYDVTQAIPDDSNKHPLTAIRQGYDALEAIANELDYDDLDDLIATKHNDADIIEEYVDDRFPDKSPDARAKLVKKLDEKIV